MASRILQTLGLSGSVTMPGYEMLGELDAPLDPGACAALGVSVRGRDAWMHRETGEIPWDEIVDKQLAHYRERPALVAHGLERHADRIANLGLLA